MQQQPIVTLSVRLPKPLVQWIDALISSGLYNSRAEVIRDFTRDYLDNKYDEGH